MGWLRRLNMMKLFSVTIAMTEDVTPPMSQTMNLSKKKNVKRTSERIVSLIMRRLPSMRLLRSAELPLSRIVMSRDLKFVQLNMSLSAGLDKKNTPITGCTKEPREVCAPAGCGFKEGAEVCYDKTSTIIQDAPKEECSLEPQRTCGHVTKLVPKLHPTEECVDVPKEVCTRSRTNPRKVKKPVVKKWCYVATEESGLA